MTVYWWSHWFWITSSFKFLLLLLFVLLPNIITNIHTHPCNGINLVHTTTISIATITNNANNTTISTLDRQFKQKFSEVAQTTTTKLYQAKSSQSALSWPKLQGNHSSRSISFIFKIQPRTTPISNISKANSYHNNKKLALDARETVWLKAKEHKRSADFVSEHNSDTVFDSTVLQVVNKLSTEDQEDSNSAKTKTGILTIDINNYTNTTDTANSRKTSTIVMTSSKSKVNFDHTNSNLTAILATASVPSISHLNQTKVTAGNVDKNENAKYIGDDNSDTDGDEHIGVFSAMDSLHKVPFTLKNIKKEDDLQLTDIEHRSRKSKVLLAEYTHNNRYINFSSDSKSLLTRSASAASNDHDEYEGNISSEALAVERTYLLNAGAISALCFTIFGICCTVGTIGIVLYRRRYLNKPQTLSEPDSSVYIDDSPIRDNSDEMYSLDNDSFLNSLEAMTIQNYWTDTVKHTKL